MSSSWTRNSLTFTTPASTTSMKYGVYEAFGDATNATEFSTFIDALQIELGASATSWDIDSDIRIVSSGQNNEEPYRIYINENTTASTTLLSLNPNGILQTTYIKVDDSSRASGIPTVLAGSNDHPFQIGTSSAQHLRFDNSKIQSVLTSSFTYWNPSVGASLTAYNISGSTLFLNPSGGDVVLGQSSVYSSNLKVFGSGSFTKGITASNAYIVINGASVSLGGSITVTGTGAPTYIQSTQPTGTPSQYLWWDTSGGNLTLWIEDGV